MRLLSFAMFLILGVLAAPERVAAQSSDAMAEALFREARSLMEAERYEEACPKLAASHELDPQNGTLLNLGTCLEKVGRTASAWAAFKELAELAPRAGQDRRGAFAAERVAALEKQLSFLTVVVDEPVSDLSVTLDEQPLLPSIFGTAVPVDPGTRVLRASAPGHEPWEQSVEVAAAARSTIEVPRLEPLPADPSPPATPAPAAAPPPRSPPRLAATTERPSSGLWPVAITAYSIAGLGLVVGGITGGLALSEGSDLECPGGDCPPSEADALDRATTLANVSNVAFAVAGAGGRGGVGDDDRRPRRRIRWRRRRGEPSRGVGELVRLLLRPTRLADDEQW